MTKATLITPEQVDACFDGLTPSGNGKGRYDIARLIEAAVLASPQIQQALADSKRIEWYFGNADKGKWMTEYEKGCAAGWTINQWRDSINSAIKEPKP